VLTSCFTEQRKALRAEPLLGNGHELLDPSALERLLVEFGGQVTDAIGDEIDRLEERLTEAAPEARHVDLEPD